MAPTSEVQDKQVAANAELKPWVDAVKAAKGRTSDDLGTKYPKISEQMWKAVQSALSGSPVAEGRADRGPVRRQVTRTRGPPMNHTTQPPDRRPVRDRNGAATAAPPPARARRGAVPPPSSGPPGPSSPR